MWPIVLGGLGIAAFIMVAMNNNKPRTPKPMGETWHFVFAIHPDIPSVEEFNQVTNQLKYIIASGGATIVDVTTEPNTLDFEVKYPIAVTTPDIGQEITLGQYTIILTEKNRVI